MLGRPVLTASTLRQHLTQLATQDIIWQPQYDAVAYAAAGQTQLTLFSLPQGQGTTTAPGAAGGKTISDTNMNAAGQLTKGNAFYMTGQEVLFFPANNPGTATQAAAATNNFLNDTYVVSKSGLLTLTIGSNRIYLQDGPLGLFPPATRLAVASAVAGTPAAAATFENTYAVMSGEVYTIVPVYIEATLGFQETIVWPVAVAPTSAAAGRLFSRLRGYLNRNAQ